MKFNVNYFCNWDCRKLLSQWHWLTCSANCNLYSSVGCGNVDILFGLVRIVRLAENGRPLAVIAGCWGGGKIKERVRDALGDILWRWVGELCDSCDVDDIIRLVVESGISQNKHCM